MSDDSKKSLRVLVVEDSEDDTLLLMRALRQGGYKTIHHRIADSESMRSALQDSEWDIIFADFSMPGFNALSALETLKETGQDIPFLIVSGTIGEDIAVTAMHKGAQDYFLKGNLARLIPAVERELREAKRRQRTNELRKQLKIAEETAHMQEKMALIGQLTAGIAHDFKNLLGTISLYSELMLDSNQLDEKNQQRATTIYSQTEVGARLVSQILDFSRRSDIYRQEVDICDLIENLQNLFRHTLRSSIDLQVEIQEPNLFVLADPTRLQQVLFNLIINARDAMPEKGELRLILERILLPPSDLLIESGDQENAEDVDWICLQVQDNGVGIPKENLDRIFEPFFTTKPAGMGTGLGLAQAYGIIKQHKGFIDVDSKINEGTTFFLYLPLHKRQTQDPMD